MATQLNAACRTFVAAGQDKRVYGHYALAAGAISHHMAASAGRGSMPDPVSVMELARLAVDHRAQGIKLGAALLQDAVNRAIMILKGQAFRRF